MEWRVSSGLVPYDAALQAMEQRVGDIIAGRAEELIWLLEHPPLYTRGTSAKREDLLNPQFPVYDAGRGGRYTYHGPGQRVAYAVLDLKRRFAPAEPDLRAYVAKLEQWLIAALAEFGVAGFVREGRVGVWVGGNPGLNPESKIAAIGIRVRRWVAYHGICLNVNPDLSHYAGIVPCGVREYGVTSLHALGVDVQMSRIDAILRQTFLNTFGPSRFL